MDLKKYNRIIWATLIILIGILFLIQNLKLFNIDASRVLFTYWPLLFILLGLYLCIFSSIAKYKEYQISKKIDINDSNNIFIRNSFTSVHKEFKGQTLADGKFAFSFCGAYIDFSGVKLRQGNNILSITTGFSDIDLKIPSRMAVKITAYITMGEIIADTTRDDGISAYIEYKTKPYSTMKTNLDIFITGTFSNIHVNFI